MDRIPPKYDWILFMDSLTQFVLSSIKSHPRDPMGASGGAFIR